MGKGKKKGNFDGSFQKFKSKKKSDFKKFDKHKPWKDNQRRDDSY